MEHPSAVDLIYPGVEALGLDQCVLATLWQARSLTLTELASRLDGVGRRVGTSVLSLALVDLQAKIESDAAMPFDLVETGTRWTLMARHDALEVLASDQKFHPAQPLSENELIVLSVIVFNGREGISHTALRRCTGDDPTAALDRLRDEGLIYVLPGEAFGYWRPSPAILRRFGLKRFSDLPGYREFRSFLQGAASRADAEKAAVRELRRAKPKKESGAENVRAEKKTHPAIARSEGEMGEG